MRIKASNANGIIPALPVHDEVKNTGALTSSLWTKLLHGDMQWRWRGISRRLQPIHEIMGVAGVCWDLSSSSSLNKKRKGEYGRPAFDQRWQKTTAQRQKACISGRRVAHEMRYYPKHYVIKQKLKRHGEHWFFPRNQKIACECQKVFVDTKNPRR